MCFGKLSTSVVFHLIVPEAYYNVPNGRETRMILTSSNKFERMNAIKMVSSMKHPGWTLASAFSARSTVDVRRSSRS